MEVKHRAFVERQSGHPMSLTLFYDEAFEGSGQGELPQVCLTEISQTDTALRKTSFAGSVKIRIAEGESSSAPAIIHKNVQVSRRHLTRVYLQMHR